MAILEPHDGREQDTVELLREFYSAIHEKGYSRDLLYRDVKHRGRFVHLRIWASEEARNEAQQDPDVHRYWMRLSEMCDITTIYEELEPVFSTYQGMATRVPFEPE